MSIKILYACGSLVAGMTPLCSHGKTCSQAFGHCLLWISCTWCCLMWQPSEFLFPQVKVSFHITLKLLMYQHLPDTQMLPGFQVLQGESGERKLKFSQNLIIEYSNHSTQVSTLQPGQGQAGCGTGQPGLVVGNPASGRGVETRLSLWSFSTQAILWFYDKMRLTAMGPQKGLCFISIFESPRTASCSTQVLENPICPAHVVWSQPTCV